MRGRDGRHTCADDCQRPVACARMALDRALPGRPRRRGRGRSGARSGLLHRLDGRRRLEDDRRRRLLGEHLGRLLQARLGRRDRRRGVRPERHLRRHGRGLDPRQRLARRRRLQIHRRGQDLDALRPGGDAPHRQGPRPPARIPTSSTSRRSATRTGRTRSAASSARRTAARPGSRSSSAARRPGRATSSWTRTTRASSTPRSGRRAASRINWSAAAPGSGLFKSTDGGDTWTEITRNSGLPKGVLGKIGVAASPAKRDRVWAIVEAEDGAVFRSDDGGETWERLTEDRNLRQRAWYYMHIYRRPDEPGDGLGAQRPGLQIDRRRQDLRPVPHPARRQPRPLDRPEEPDADDRGQRRRRDGLLQRRRDVVDALQPADGGVLPRHHRHAVPYRSTARSRTTRRSPCRAAPRWRPSRSRSGTRSAAARAATSPSARTTRTSSSRAVTAASITRYDRRTGQRRNINVWPEEHLGWGAKDVKYRFQWTFPIMLSPHDPNVLYITGNHVFRSTDEGSSWEVISPDLTRNDLIEAGRLGRADHQGQHRRGVLLHDLRLRRVARAAGRPLGRLGRRPGPRLARQRRDTGRTSRRTICPNGR